MALVRRLLVVLLGYCAASVAAGAILIAFQVQAWSNMLGLDLNLALLVVYGFLHICGYLFLPALVVLAVTEALCIQRALDYAILGALGLVLFAWYVSVIELLAGTHFRDGVVAAVVSGAGVVAGIVYWSIAGRNAGLWRKSPSSLGI